MELTSLPIVYHKCDRFPNDGVKKVYMDYEGGWAYHVENTAWNFPTYKDCCHFFEDETCTKEIDLSGIKPKLNI